MTKANALSWLRVFKIIETYGGMAEGKYSQVQQAYVPTLKVFFGERVCIEFLT